MDDTTLSRRMEAHRRELVLHCYRMLGAGPDAEDATQDAFLKAWQARQSLASEGALRARLYRIAHKNTKNLICGNGVFNSNLL